MVKNGRNRIWNRGSLLLDPDTKWALHIHEYCVGFPIFAPHSSYQLPSSHFILWKSIELNARPFLQTISIANSTTTLYHSLYTHEQGIPCVFLPLKTVEASGHDGVTSLMHNLYTNSICTLSPFPYDQTPTSSKQKKLV